LAFYPVLDAALLGLDNDSGDLGNSPMCDTTTPSRRPPAMYTREYRNVLQHRTVFTCTHRVEN
jgi:hypothetical protein